MWRQNNIGAHHWYAVRIDRLNLIDTVCSRRINNRHRFKPVFERSFKQVHVVKRLTCIHM